MAVQPPQTQFTNLDTAPTARGNLNANASQVSNLLLSLRRTIQSGETFTLYTYEDLTHRAPYEVQAGGHVQIQNGAHLRITT